MERVSRPLSRCDPRVSGLGGLSGAANACAGPATCKTDSPASMALPPFNRVRRDKSASSMRIAPFNVNNDYPLGPDDEVLPLRPGTP